MPGASQGAHVSTSAQVEPNSIESTDIKDGEIVNADIAAAAAIAQSKLALAITNTEVDAAAGIVDTKLAAIATAGKVSGAALTLLANIPAGAGVIPSANLPGASGVGGFVVSDNLKHSADTERTKTTTGYTLVKQFKVFAAGEVRVKFKGYQQFATNAGGATVYKNGADLGTIGASSLPNAYTQYSGDITVVPGDLIQLYYKAEAGQTVGVKEFRMYYDVGNIATIGQVDTD